MAREIFRLHDLHLADETPLPFDLSPESDFVGLFERWKRLLDDPRVECRAVAQLYVWSQKHPDNPPSPFDSFVDRVFQGVIDEDPAKWEAAGNTMVDRPGIGGIPAERGVPLGLAVLAYLRAHYPISP